LEQEKEVRLAALSTLGDLSKKNRNIRNIAIPHIIVKLDDRQEQVRWRASNILKELGVEGSVIEHYNSARKQIAFVEPYLKELHLTTTIDLSDIKEELKSAKDMLKGANYVSADDHATRLKDMFIKLKASCRPEMDARLKDWKEFSVGTHTPFQLLLVNPGIVHIYDIGIKFSADVEVTEDLPPLIKAGETQILSLAWTPEKPGRIPLKVSLSFQDSKATLKDVKKDIWLDVVSPVPDPLSRSEVEWPDQNEDMSSALPEKDVLDWE